jgi:cellulose biosynthesis protein BcsQ
MRGDSPYLIVLAAAADRVGRSTLTGNLAVYLKGLLEDLPVAVISFDPAYDPARTFLLPGNPATSTTDLFAGQSIETQLTLGQFGVEYMAAGCLPLVQPSQLRQLLRESSYPGILIVDAGPLDGNSAASALQAADLVLAPVRDAAGLAALAGIRRELRAGGGNDQMLWLVPSMVEDPQQQARQLELLRFAAEERGCQVLDDEFVVDAQLPHLTRGAGGSVLTRMPGSQAHQLLQRLAQLALQQFEKGVDSSCRLQRLKLDNALASRSRRVELVCPLCGQPACFTSTHYCESLPQRRRWLMHADCLNRLMAERRLQPFWRSDQAAVLRTGVESGGLLPQLRLLLADGGGGLLESELFQPDTESGWQALVRHATGRTLAEQFPSLIMLYPATAGQRLLSADWYRNCVALRKSLRAGLAAELL